jgi:hypothetical protein
MNDLRNRPAVRRVRRSNVGRILVALLVGVGATRAYAGAATARTTAVLKWVVLSLVGVLGLAGTGHAAPIRTLTDLVSITFWEATGSVSARAFPPLPIPPGGNFPPTTNPGLLNRRTSPLGGFSNFDFRGLTNEFYDVFYSDPNGDLNMDGECLTVEAEFDSPTGGGGLNIAEVQLNFVDGSTSFMCDLASAVSLGVNAIPGSAQLAVDGNLSTATVMGNTSGQPLGTRLRITLCSPCAVGEPTPAVTPSATATLTATATATPIPCVGDCNGDGTVSINELILMVNIALGILPPSACTAGDADHDGSISIGELITAVNNALDGCPCGFIGPRMCGGACPNVADVCQPLPDDSGCVCRPGAPRPTSTATVPPRATPTRTPAATATATSVGSPCVPPPPGMVAWWALDEAAGATTVVDIGLPPGNDGVPQSAPISAPGGPLGGPGNLVTNPPDGALMFYQPSTYVDVPSSTDLDLANSDLTIDAWIRPTEVHPVLPGVVEILEPIVDKLGTGNSGYALYLHITATCSTCNPVPPSPPGTQQTVVIRLVFAIGNGALTSFYQSNAIYTGTFGVNPSVPIAPPWPDWLHIAVTVDRAAGSIGRFYLNGGQAGGFTPVAGVNSTAAFWIGGTRLVPVPIAFHGEIEINELEVFNVALTQPQIQSIAAASAGKCKSVTPIATSTATAPRSPTATATRSSTASLTPTRPINTATRTPTRAASPTSTSTRTRTSTATFTPRATSTPTPTIECEAPRSVLLSTGNASIGANDPIWSLTGAPAGTANFPPARPAIVIGTYPGWSTVPNTQWITANTVCGQMTGCTDGVYEYELCWEQCGELVDPMPFMALADNRAEVFLDNVFLIAVPGFNGVPTSFSVNTGPGTHSLRVAVTNDLLAGFQTPTGLDLSGILTGQIQLVTCPARPPTFTPTGTVTRTPTRTPNGLPTG